MKPGIVPAVTSILVGCIFIAIGFWARSQAPADANAATALMVPGIAGALMILLGAATAAIPSAARTTVPIAALVSLVFFGAAAGRIYPALQARQAYLESKEQWDRSIAEKKRQDRPEDMIAFLKTKGDGKGNEGLTHDTAYFLNALYACAAAGLVGCIALAVMRPRAA